MTQVADTGSRTRSTATGTCRASSRSPSPSRDDNCTDVHSNDLGFLVIAEAASSWASTCWWAADSGGRTGRRETFPRLADPLGFVKPEELVEVARAVIAVQRDHGNRENRKRARLKYLIDERGVDWFRERGRGRIWAAGSTRRPGAESPASHDHLGWHDQGDGRWFRGVWVENGRIQDAEGLPPAHRAAPRRRALPSRCAPDDAAESAAYQRSPGGPRPDRRDPRSSTA